MGLSEQELKLLEELEKSFEAGPAKEAKRKLSSGNVSARRIIFGTVVVLAGIITLLVGVMNRNMIIGVVGFAAMLTGAYLASSTQAS